MRRSHDDFGHPSFEVSRSFLNQVLAHFDLLRELEGDQGVSLFGKGLGFSQAHFNEVCAAEP